MCEMDQFGRDYLLIYRSKLGQVHLTPPLKTSRCFIKGLYVGGLSTELDCELSSSLSAFPEERTLLRDGLEYGGPILDYPTPSITDSYNSGTEVSSIPLKQCSVQLLNTRKEVYKGASHFIK
ncbi:uncharacterized protein LOC144613242 isoform X3 [Panthera onca]